MYVRALGYVRSACDTPRHHLPSLWSAHPKFYLRSHRIPMLLTVPIFRRFPLASGQGNLSNRVGRLIDESAKKEASRGIVGRETALLGSLSRSVDKLTSWKLSFSFGVLAGHVRERVNVSRNWGNTLNVLHTSAVLQLRS